MRRAVTAAVVLAAAASFAPNAAALPPIPGWPLGFTCQTTQLADPTPGTDNSYVFKLEGGPLLPVTDTGERVSDVEVSCLLKVVPDAHPAVTLQGTSTRIGEVAYLPPKTAVAEVGDGYTITYCSRLTWTDSTGAARTGGSCRTR